MVILLLLCSGYFARAQLRDAGANAPGKNFWYGLTGRDSLAISRVWTASLVLPGYSQAYNRDYWKIPVVWGGIGGMIGGAIYNNRQYQHTGAARYKAQRNWFYVGAAAVYWGSLLDGIISYDTHREVVPARAALYSAMLPGMGQIYNGHYWKLPIVYGGLIFTTYLVDFNNTQYSRFRKAYDLLTDGNDETVDEFGGRYTEANLKYYRDNYRRSRDYAILFTVLIYALNIIDANVFAHLKDFDVSDNLSLRVSPAIINYDALASRADYSKSAVGMRLNLTF